MDNAILIIVLFIRSAQYYALHNNIRKSKMVLCFNNYGFKAIFAKISIARQSPKHLQNSNVYSIHHTTIKCLIHFFMMKRKNTFLWEMIWLAVMCLSIQFDFSLEIMYVNRLSIPWLPAMPRYKKRYFGNNNCDTSLFYINAPKYTLNLCLNFKLWIDKIFLV